MGYRNWKVQFFFKKASWSVVEIEGWLKGDGVPFIGSGFGRDR